MKSMYVVTRIGDELEEPYTVGVCTSRKAARLLVNSDRRECREAMGQGAANIPMYEVNNAFRWTVEAVGVYTVRGTKLKGV